MAESQHLAKYLVDMTKKGEVPNSGFVAYLSSLEQVNSISPLVASSIVSELADQFFSSGSVGSGKFVYR